MRFEERNKAAAFLVLRAFLVQFWFLQFLGKIRDSESGIIAVRNLEIWSRHTTDWFVKGTPLPELIARPYTLAVPWVELAISALLLIGWQTRRTLLAAAWLLVSLDVGMMLQGKHDVVGINSIHLLTVLLALFLQPFARWTLDSRLAARKSS
ncbi:MAG TPA: hypothetical protein VIG99_04180 [Myxococcaceae bacterium]|jgi:thiosulfate dehydrogenase [quinone] large subunit